ncbi:MAG: hypothetical protein Q4D38_00540 [Planctomycetia bacterium]|nr:hypothetical protein [Planctomycetia bacterium]
MLSRFWIYALLCAVFVWAETPAAVVYYAGTESGTSEDATNAAVNWVNSSVEKSFSMDGDNVYASIMGTLWATEDNRGSHNPVTYTYRSSGTQVKWDSFSIMSRLNAPTENDNAGIAEYMTFSVDQNYDYLRFGVVVDVMESTTGTQSNGVTLRSSNSFSWTENSAMSFSGALNSSTTSIAAADGNPDIVFFDIQGSGGGNWQRSQSVLYSGQYGGKGNVGNAYNVFSYTDNATKAETGTIALNDSDGDPTSVTFCIDGGLQGWVGNSDHASITDATDSRNLLYDYVFADAGGIGTTAFRLSWLVGAYFSNERLVERNEN